MTARTKLVAFRLTPEEFRKLSGRASAAGLSPGAFAREALGERFAREDKEHRGVAEVHAQVRALRDDVALATRAILTVIGDPITPQKAEEWVRKNLNR